MASSKILKKQLYMCDSSYSNIMKSTLFNQNLDYISKGPDSKGPQSKRPLQRVPKKRVSQQVWCIFRPSPSILKASPWGHFECTQV